MRVDIYDTTLRDGTQAEGIDFSVDDKIRIAIKLDRLGVHYLEGGWPGSNPNSIAFLEQIRHAPLSRMKVAAFGSTRHAKNRCATDENIQMLLRVKTPVITIFGKSWDMHVRDALRVSLETNIEMIRDSVAYLKSKGREVVYDAEHFFDGYKHNSAYALATLAAAAEAGADVLCLCETNGGAIPSEVAVITRAVRACFPAARLGIHTHNDSGCGVANALAAVEEGVTHVQGTINGYGERCGNANLVPIIANLDLKMHRKALGSRALGKLTELSRFVAELANQIPDERAPYVGRSAFAHKGGIHVSAVLRNSACYEHIAPEVVGNSRRVLVSDQSGRANLVYKIRELGLTIAPDAPELTGVLKEVKRLENEGYEFESAEASFALLIERAMGRLPQRFGPVTWRILDEFIAGENFVSAMVKVKIGRTEYHMMAEGNGPFNALDNAFRRALVETYPEIERMKLVDYKVRVLSTEHATAEAVRVLIQSSDGTSSWGTVGVSANILEASWIALVDSINFFLLRTRGRSTTPRARSKSAPRRSPRRQRTS